MSQSTVPAFAGQISFNANHSPMGAFMSFTCGHAGTRGGFGLQNGRPGDQELYVGVKTGDRKGDGVVKVLPFYEGAGADEAARYDVEKSGGAKKPGMTTYGSKEIKRHYGWGSDKWVMEDFEFTIYSPFGPIPEDESPSHMRDALCPAVVAEMVICNRTDQVKTGVFAMRANVNGIRLLNEGVGLGRLGFALGNRWGVLGELEGGDGKIQPIMRWGVAEAMREVNEVHLLGNTPGLTFEVRPGETKRLRLALGCFLDGAVTTRIEGRYLYTKYFANLQDVLGHALDKFDDRQADAEARDRELLDSGLSADQQFMIAHSTRSYYNSTQLLDVGGRPFWIVNEGEYCMMNTLDLSVDHLFWELKQNPWVIRNLLDNFTRHYCYVDQVKVPGSSGQYDLKPGGLSFCHDMGVHNNFSLFTHSSYELPNLPGCFSYMTAEQVCNWTLMAGGYVAKTDDMEWLGRNQPIIEACLESLLNRGGEAGFCQYDSSRCGSGAEITTYDSLDHSLAQTRANVYMATKTWACYLGLAGMLERLGNDRAKAALEAAGRVERVVMAAADSDGVLPAVFEKDNPGYASRILPAVEGLIYPLMAGDERLDASSPFVKALHKHAEALLTDPKRGNLFAEGGLKLSSTSNNSWMSKIAIFMHVARRVLKLDDNPAIAKIFTDADADHVRWQTETQGIDGSAYWACSDQMVSGVAKGSKYYPRIITSALWLEV